MKAKPLDPVMVEMFWNRALGLTRPFTLRDITGYDARPERRLAGMRWLQERVNAKDLRRVKVHKQTFYEWIN